MSTTTPSAPAVPSAPRIKLSYTLPAPVEPIPLLSLPPLHTPRHGRPNPLVIPHYPPKYSLHSDSSTKGDGDESGISRHRFGVASLAIDSRARRFNGEGEDVVGEGGRLFTGGRDGQLITHELGLSLRARKVKYGFSPPSSVSGIKSQGSQPSPRRSSHSTNRSSITRGSRSRKHRWESITGWEDAEAEFDDDDEDSEPTGKGVGGDGDVLGEVVLGGLGVGLGRRKKWDGTLREEEKWECQGWNDFHSRPISSIQAHSDWINDLLLIDSNRTVISASSDNTIKAHLTSSSTHFASNTPTLIGTHADYVRSLTASPHQKWLASGSLDRTIKLWDPTATPTSNPMPITTLISPSGASSNADEKTSIYSVDVTDIWGSGLVSGGPERVVRLWDVRSGKGTGKLVGHTDVVKVVKGGCWNGDYLLTASSDATVKLWSLRQPSRCLHTFTMHTSSIWSLYSDHPRLEVFYSGDKDGNLCKVDARNVGDVSEAECVLIGRTTESADGSGRAIGVGNIVVIDERWIWACSEQSDVLRWRDPGPRSERTSSSSLPKEGYLAQNYVSHKHLHDEDEFEVEVDPMSETSPHGLPYSSLVYLESPTSGLLGMSGMMKTSRPNGALSSFVFSPPPSAFHTRSAKSRPPHSPVHSSTHTPPGKIAHPPPSKPKQAKRSSVQFLHPQSIQHTPVHASFGDQGEQQPPQITPLEAFETRDSLPMATPLNQTPSEITTGSQRGGILRCLILNDRMHALSVDTRGEIALWNIVRCKCLGFFPPLPAASSSEKLSPRDALEAVCERIEGECVTNTWCRIDNKVGEMRVILEERCFEGECFLDEVVDIGSVVDADGEDEDNRLDEYRVNIARWVLSNLLKNFVSRLLNEQVIKEQQQQLQSQQQSLHSRANPPRHIALPSAPQTPSNASSSSLCTPDGGSSFVPQSPAIKSAQNTPGFASVPSVLDTIPQSPPPVPPLSSRRGRSNSSLPTVPLDQGATPRPHAMTSDQPGPVPGSGHSRRPSLTLEAARTAANTASPGSGADYFSNQRNSPRPMSANPGLGSRDPSRASAAIETPEDFSGWGGKEKEKDAEKKEAKEPTTPGGGFMSRFTWRRRKTIDAGTNGEKRPTSSGGTQKSVEEKPATPATEVKPLTAVENILISGTPLTPPSSSWRDVPPLRINLPPPFTMVSLTDLVSSAVLFSGSIDSLGHDGEVTLLKEHLPLWIADTVLYGKVPTYTPAKVSFTLVPWKGSGLPDLSTSSSRLTASRFLRTRKVSAYVHEKLEIMAAHAMGRFPSNSSLPPGLPPPTLAIEKLTEPPEEVYEILCNNTLLPWYMTLAVVKQYIWQTPGELTMQYRKKARGHSSLSSLEPTE